MPLSRSPDRLVVALAGLVRSAVQRSAPDTTMPEPLAQPRHPSQPNTASPVLASSLPPRRPAHPRQEGGGS